MKFEGKKKDLDIAGCRFGKRCEGAEERGKRETRSIPVEDNGVAGIEKLWTSHADVEGSGQTIVIHATSGSFCRNKQPWLPLCVRHSTTRGEQVLFDLPVVATRPFVPSRTLAVHHGSLPSSVFHYLITFLKRNSVLPCKRLIDWPMLYE